MRSFIVMCAALVVITLGVYWQAGTHAFLTYDDTTYVTQNPHVISGLTGSNLRWAFTSTEGGNWHPITWLSHMADVELYGLQPRGHHLTNVGIHCASTLLLLLLLFRTTGALGKSALVAALFALHPLHVESVAWVAERKDLLSTFFGLLTLLLYAAYAAQPRPARYLATFGTFVLALMSKPMLVTLPAVMLLLDFWPLRRYRSGRAGAAAALKEKIPFFVCSLLVASVTLLAQQRVLSSLDRLPPGARCANALLAYLRYLEKTLWPRDLSVLYPLDTAIPLWQAAGALLLLLAVSVATLRLGRRFPYLPAGWFWFVITLVPVIGLVQVGIQALADRYTYLPLIGIFIMAAWGGADLAERLPRSLRPIPLLLGIAVIGAAALATRHQLGYWRDSFTLYRHTLQVTDNNYMIRNNLGTVFFEGGDLEGAIREFREALRINPEFVLARRNLGLAYYRSGNLDGAIAEYLAALRLSPDAALTHFNLGQALARKGDRDGAAREFREAFRSSPGFAPAGNVPARPQPGNGPAVVPLRR